MEGTSFKIATSDSPRPWHNEFRRDLRSFSEPSAYLRGFISRSLQAKGAPGRWGGEQDHSKEAPELSLPRVGFRIPRERPPIGLYSYHTPSIPPPLQTESWQVRSVTACQLRGLLEGDVRVHRGRRKQRGVHGRRALPVEP